MIGFLINKIDLTDLSEETILKIGKLNDLDGLLGLENIIEIPLSLQFDFDTYAISREFQIQGNNIYFILDENLICYDLRTNTQTTILQEILYGATVTENAIYYLDENRNLNKYEQENQVITTQEVSQYYITDNDLVYCITTDDELYKVVGDLSIKNSDFPATFILYADEDVIIFNSFNGTVINDGAQEYQLEIYCTGADKDFLYFYDGSKFVVMDYLSVVVEEFVVN